MSLEEEERNNKIRKNHCEREGFCTKMKMEVMRNTPVHHRMPHMRACRTKRERGQ